MGAALTVVAAYLRAGSPKQELTAFGSFEKWSHLIRGCLVWAGEPDPCDTRERLRVLADPSTIALRTALKHLSKLARKNEGSFTAAELHDAWSHDAERDAAARNHPDLWPALEELLPNRVSPGMAASTKQIGVLLRRHKDRPAGGRRLALATKRGHGVGNRWVIEKVAKGKGASTTKKK